MIVVLFLFYFLFLKKKCSIVVFFQCIEMKKLNEKKNVFGNKVTAVRQCLQCFLYRKEKKYFYYSTDTPFNYRYVHLSWKTTKYVPIYLYYFVFSYFSFVLIHHACWIFTRLKKWRGTIDNLYTDKIPKKKIYATYNWHRFFFFFINKTIVMHSKKEKKDW